METCVNGLIGTVNWILDYGGHKFFFFFFGLRYLVDGYRLMYSGFETCWLDVSFCVEKGEFGCLLRCGDI